MHKREESERFVEKNIREFLNADPERTIGTGQNAGRAVSHTGQREISRLIVVEPQAVAPVNQIPHVQTRTLRIMDSPWQKDLYITLSYIVSRPYLREVTL